MKHATICEPDSRNGAKVELQRRDLAGNNRQSRERAQLTLNATPEQAPVGLNPRPPNRTSLGAIEHPIMDRGIVCCACYHAIKRVDLPHQMTFAEAANGGIAAHGPDLRGIEGDQCHTQTHSCCDG